MKEEIEKRVNDRLAKEMKMFYYVETRFFDDGTAKGSYGQYIC